MDYKIDCPQCDGEGEITEYCCSGIDRHDGSISCGCYGRGVSKDCSQCNGEGEIVMDSNIIWNFETLTEEDRHDNQVYYSIMGASPRGEYVGTCVYTDGKFDYIEDVEKI